MRNRYPKACSICQGLVPAGEGILYQDGSGWSVTHSGPCPRGLRDNASIRHGHAQAFAKRAFRITRRSDATLEEIHEAVRSFAALVRTGWTKKESVESILLNSRALEGMDRLQVEDILGQLSFEDSHA